ncbi:MAG: hypothetical protein R3C02_00490 [Planctomycetaceae bacterium]
MRTKRELTNTTASGGRQSPDPSNASDAYTRALTRFGNPAKIARKLWLDAMQEKLMAQRLTIGALAVITLVAIGMFVLTWRAMDNVQVLMQDNRDTNTALLARLESLAATPIATNYEWCQFRVRLTEDDHEGPPAEGMTVGLQKIVDGFGGGSQAATATNSSISYPFQELTSDEQGIADFSPVPYGPYHLTVKTPDGHMLKKDIAVRAGHGVDLTIACPVSAREGKVTLKLNLDDVKAPDDVRDRLWVLCRIYQQNPFKWGHFSDDQEGQNGTFLDGDRWIMWESREVLVSEDGAMYLVEWPQYTEELKETSLMFGDRTSTHWMLDETYTLPRDSSPIESIRLPVGEWYHVDYELVFFTGDPDDPDEMRWELIDDDSELLHLTDRSIEDDGPPIANNVIAGTTTEWLINVQGAGFFNGEPIGRSPATNHQLIRPSEPLPFNHPDFDSRFQGVVGGGQGFF